MGYGSGSWRHEEGSLGAWGCVPGGMPGPCEHEVPDTLPAGAERPVPAHGGGVPLDADDREGLGIPQRECSVGGDTGGGPSVLPRRFLSLPWDEDAPRG